MKKSVMKNIIAISTLIIASLNIIGFVFSMLLLSFRLIDLLNIALIVLPIVLLMTTEPKREKAIIIIILTIFSIQLMNNVLNRISITRISDGLSFIPFVFSIVYLVNDQKNQHTNNNVGISSSEKHNDVTEKFTASKKTLEARLTYLEKLYKDGLISSSEYEEKRKDIINSV